MKYPYEVMSKIKEEFEISFSDILKIKNPVFVFGSNLAGRHGKGAALFAKEYFGAIYGNGVGIMGNSYAIPTKDRRLKVLSLELIGDYIKDFLVYSKNHSDKTFLITAVGCGYAGFSEIQIAPFFKDVSNNCILSKRFKNID